MKTWTWPPMRRRLASLVSLACSAGVAFAQQQENAVGGDSDLLLQYEAVIEPDGDIVLMPTSKAAEQAETEIQGAEANDGVNAGIGNEPSAAQAPATGDGTVQQPTGQVAGQDSETLGAASGGGGWDRELREIGRNAFDELLVGAREGACRSRLRPRTFTAGIEVSVGFIVCSKFTASGTWDTVDLCADWPAVDAGGG